MGGRRFREGERAADDRLDLAFLQEPGDSPRDLLGKGGLSHQHPDAVDFNPPKVEQGKVTAATGSFPVPEPQMAMRPPGLTAWQSWLKFSLAMLSTIPSTPRPFVSSRQRATKFSWR